MLKAKIALLCLIWLPLDSYFTLGYCGLAFGQAPASPAELQNSDEETDQSEFQSRWMRHSAKGPLTVPERPWVLRDGTQLIGKAYLLPGGGGLVGVQRERFPGPGQRLVSVPLSKFTDEDQTVIPAGFRTVPANNRRFALYQGVEVSPQWESAQPQFPKRYHNVVSLEGDELYFSSGFNLIAVHKSYFTKQFLDETASALAKIGHQLVLDIGKSPIVAIGEPQREIGDSFLMRVNAPYGQGHKKFAEGFRYLLPQHLLSPEVAEQVRLVCKKVQAQKEPATDSPDEIEKAPRLCSLVHAWAFVDAPAEPLSELLVATTLSGQPLKWLPHNLRCVDQRWWEEANLPADADLTDEQRELQVLAKLFDSLDKRDRWSQHRGNGSFDIFSGKLVGRLADGFIFREGSVHFMVLASDLAPVDLRVAALASQTRRPDWPALEDPALVDLRELCATRVVGASIVRVESEQKRLDGALVGIYPKLTYMNGKVGTEMPLSEYNAWHTARTTLQWLQENDKLLQGDDNARIAAVLNAKYPPQANADIQLASLPPDRRVHRWTLRGTSERFDGVLVGQYQQDLVFETTINEQTKYFLASPDALDAESKSLSEQLLPRVEPKDWPQLLSRAENWQHYRVWFDPNNRVRTPSGPSAVESISNSLIRFRHIDGDITSQPMPRDAESAQEYTEFYEPAMTAALQARQAAEAGLTLWTFQDCEPTLRAELIGDAGASFIVRDVNNAEFLVNKVCLTEASLRDLLHLQRTMENLKTVDAAEVWKMPRVWCTRTKLIGPAVPDYLTSDSAQLVTRTLDGGFEVVKMSNLTLREQLSFVKDWQLQHNLVDPPPELATADSIESLNRWLTEPIARKDILQDCPALNADIQREVVDAFAGWTHDTWEAVEIALPSDKPLLAVNADATAGIVAAAAQWQVIDFASGEISSLPIAHQAANQPAIDVVGDVDGDAVGDVDGDAAPAGLLGPWMGSEPRQAYWVESGALMRATANDSLEPTSVLPDETPKIVAACQTPNWEYLVFLCGDGSVRRWQIPGGPLEMIAPNIGGRHTNEPSNKIWASRTGESVVLGIAFSTSLHVKATANSPTLSGFVGAIKPIEFAVVGRDSAWLDMLPGSRQLTQLKGATTFLRPTEQGLPFLPSWSGIIEVDGKEVLQSIGRCEDAVAVASDTNYVVYTGTKGYFEQFATQRIVGQIDGRALVAANGAAVVHWRGEQAVISRRPAALALAPPLQLSAIIERLVAQGDIGQLEALGRFLEQPPYSLYGRSNGWLNIKFHELVKLALFRFQPQFGGDRLGRALQLADRFREQYPRSQVATTALADIERNLAWSARGGGYAGSVTEAGSEAFRAHMQSAAELLEPLLDDEPMAGTLRALIDVAMATGRLDLAGKVAKQLEFGKHAQNSELHHALAFLLLPRWHGSIGSSEAYRDKVARQLGGAEGDIMYAELVIEMLGTHGFDQPLSTRMTIDLQRVLNGTLAYYKTRSDANLIDSTILLMALEGKTDWVTQLVKLKSEKQLLPSATAAASAQTFQSIETKLGN